MGHEAESQWSRCTPVTFHTSLGRIVTTGFPRRISLLCPGPFAMCLCCWTCLSFLNWAPCHLLSLTGCTTSDGVQLLRLRNHCICSFETPLAWKTIRGPGIAAIVDSLTQSSTPKPCSHTQELSSHQGTELQVLPTPVGSLRFGCFVTQQGHHLCSTSLIAVT